MTDIAADDLLVADDEAAIPPEGFAANERQPQAMKATLFFVNILLLIGVLAFAWTPAVIFWVALALAPITLAAILAITLGWWM
ncbi:hypothetical protein [Ferrovibrio sp.]|uniref:hypothetical protein n=1 Tax=Ferrovibrio sp. TaxID=1917215 RepID=UPI0035AF853B